jgi:hypothetical protein
VLSALFLTDKTDNGKEERGWKRQARSACKWVREPPWAAGGVGSFVSIFTRREKREAIIFHTQAAVANIQLTKESPGVCVTRATQNHALTLYAHTSPTRQDLEKRKKEKEAFSSSLSD